MKIELMPSGYYKAILKTKFIVVITYGTTHADAIKRGVARFAEVAYWK